MILSSIDTFNTKHHDNYTSILGREVDTSFVENILGKCNKIKCDGEKANIKLAMFSNLFLRVRLYFIFK